MPKLCWAVVALLGAHGAKFSSLKTALRGNLVQEPKQVSVRNASQHIHASRWQQPLDSLPNLEITASMVRLNSSEVGEVPVLTGRADSSSNHSALTWGDAVPPRACNTQNTIWDIGFFDGKDSKTYLESGYCVLGVEADPSLVWSARHALADRLQTQQLVLLNIALAPQLVSVVQHQTFYLNSCTKEWNSFSRNVGCRACQPPYHIDDTACTPTEVSAVSCDDLFTHFGVPYYLKMDIEGAETGCFQAMQAHLQRGERTLPQFISSEATSTEYIDAMYHLGYKYFKLARQDTLVVDGVSTTGPWGYNALDCRTATAWRTYEEVRVEMLRVMEPADLTENDACPKGVVDIRKQGNGAVWYDVHAML